MSTFNSFKLLGNNGSVEVNSVQEANWIHILPQNEVFETVGDRVRENAEVALYAASDLLRHGRYPNSSPDLHLYNGREVGEEIGVAKKDGKWYVLSVVDDDQVLSPANDRQALKHTYANILLKGKGLRLWIAHIRPLVETILTEQWLQEDDAIAAQSRNGRYNSAMGRSSVRASTYKATNHGATTIAPAIERDPEDPTGNPNPAGRNGNGKILAFPKAGGGTVDLFTMVRGMIHVRNTKSKRGEDLMWDPTVASIVQGFKGMAQGGLFEIE
jgi:hypothetical protein